MLAIRPTSLCRVAPTCLALLAVACSSGDGEAPTAGGNMSTGAPTGQAGPVPANGATPAPATPASGLPNVPGLRGKDVTVHVTDKGEVSVPSDFSTTPPSALVTNADGYDVYPGQGDAQGNFIVPNVPDVAGGARVFVKMGTYYFETTSRTPQRGNVALGRSSRRAVTPNTKVKLAVSGMSPWTDFDFLTLLSENAGAVSFNYGGATPPGAGATSLTNLVDHYASDSNWLIDAAAGDQTQLLHYAVDASTNCRRVSQVATAPSFTTTEGQTSTLTGAFTAVPSTSTLNITWKVGFYESHRLSVHPTATQSSQQLQVVALPGADRFGDFTAAPNLVYCGFENPGTADVPITMQFGNPLPARFVPYVVVGQVYAVPVALPGVTPTEVYASVSHVRTALTGVEEATLSPVRSLKVAGKNAQASQTAVGTTPIVSWEAPVVGKVVRYDVSVVEVYAEAGATKTRAVAQVTTSSTNVRLPPGVLTTGRHYYVNVAATATETSTYDETLSEKGFGITNAARADAVSSVFTP